MQDRSGPPFPSKAGDRKAPPPKTRLYWSSLTNTEKSVLDAMYEHCWDGSYVYASLQRIADYAKVSRKTVQRVLHGDERSPQCKTQHLGLIKRGIVSELAPANPVIKGVREKKPASYRINAEALQQDPRMKSYKRPAQMVLPGMRRVVAAVESDHGPTVQGHALDHGPTVQATTDLGSSNPLKPDPLTKPLTHHADGAMTDIHAWLAIKEMLRDELTPTEWDLVIRPARLLRTMPGNTLQIAVPPSGAIMAAALKHKQLLNDVAGRAGLRIVLTRYPDEWERAQLQERFGIDHSRKK